MLGLRPIGSLSLSFAFTYFLGLGILALLPIVIRSGSNASLSYIGLLLVLTLLGVVIFFFPLNTIHKKMTEVKKLEQEVLRKKMSKAIQDESKSRTDDSQLSISDTNEMLSIVTKALIISITRDEVAEMPTWPFDISIISRLSAMLVTIITIILANLILRQIF
jgi:hypothetical protein